MIKPGAKVRITQPDNLHEFPGWTQEKNKALDRVLTVECVHINCKTWWASYVKLNEVKGNFSLAWINDISCLIVCERKIA